MEDIIKYEAIQRACDADLYTNREDNIYLGSFGRYLYTVEDAQTCYDGICDMMLTQENDTL